jgi:magnesium transporter
MEDKQTLFLHLNKIFDHKLYDEAKEILEYMHPADLADYIDNSSFEIKQEIINVLASKLNPEVFVELEPNSVIEFLQMLGPEDFAGYIKHLDTEEAIEILAVLENNDRIQVISNLPEKFQKEVSEGLAYPEHTTGRIMDKNFIALQEDWSVEYCQNFLQRKKNLYKDIHSAIIIDKKHNPVGTLTLSNLLLHNKTEKLIDIMETNFKIADVLTEHTDLAYIFKQYGLTIVPVVNKKKKLVGAISIENMVYVIDREAEEDIMYLGGVNEKDIYRKYLFTARHRFPWLFVTLITACMSSLVLDMFSATINQMVSLAVVLPIVAALGGNAGTQTVTVSVRGLATKDLNSINALKVILKEIIVCGINGLMLAIVGAIAILVLYSNLSLSIVFATAVLFNVIVSGFLGATIPLVLNSLDIDPAVASNVFLIALTDIIGYLSFLLLSYYFLL